jgi:hypothetical protein
MDAFHPHPIIQESSIKPCIRLYDVYPRFLKFVAFVGVRRERGICIPAGIGTTAAWDGFPHALRYRQSL